MSCSDLLTPNLNPSIEVSSVVVSSGYLGTAAVRSNRGVIEFRVSRPEGIF